MYFWSCVDMVELVVKAYSSIYQSMVTIEFDFHFFFQIWYNFDLTLSSSVLWSIMSGGR